MNGMEQLSAPARRQYIGFEGSPWVAAKSVEDQVVGRPGGGISRAEALDERSGATPSEAQGER